MVNNMSDTKEQIERNKRLLAAKVAMNGPPAPRALVDAGSIRGKMVDDSEIGDGKTLTYNSVKDKIVYKLQRGGGGGGVNSPASRELSGLQPSYIMDVYDGRFYGKSTRAACVDLSGTDPDVVVNAVLTALNAVGGGKAFFKGGTWTPLDSSLLMPGPNIVLDGEGYASFLDFTADTRGIDFNSQPFCAVRNLRLRGTGGGAMAGVLNSGRRGLVENCWISRFGVAGCGTGAIELCADWVRAVNNHVYNCAAHGITLSGNAQGYTVIGNHVGDWELGGFVDGISVTSATVYDSVIANNFVSACTHQGIEISPGIDTLVIGNCINGSGNAQIYLDNAIDCSIVGNYGRQTNWELYGVEIVNGDDILVCSNKFISGGGQGSIGIYLINGDDCEITNNRLKGFAVGIDGNAAAVVRPQIMGNNWEGCAGDSTFATATTPRITANVDKNGAWWATGDAPS
jgi:hypothetical protein